MKLIIFYFAILSIVISCKPAEIEKAEMAEIRYCNNCIDVSDAINFENSISSKRLYLTSAEIGTHIAKMVTYLLYTDNKNIVSFDDDNLLFQRESSLKGFSEFILYSYYAGFQCYADSTLMDVGMLEFNLGNTLLGFAVNSDSIIDKDFIRNPSNFIRLSDFQSGYYAILKWLYSLETKNRKVVKSRIKHFDKDKYSSPEVELEDMVLEDPWQEEFLFHKYELKGDDDYSYFVSIEPKTYAPIYLYEKRPDHYKPGEGYYINISDMSIRIMFSAEFTGLDKAL